MRPNTLPPLRQSSIYIHVFTNSFYTNTQCIHDFKTFSDFKQFSSTQIGPLLGTPFRRKLDDRYVRRSFLLICHVYKYFTYITWSNKSFLEHHLIKDFFLHTLFFQLEGPMIRLMLV